MSTLLSSVDLASCQPLGAVGIPVHAVAGQIRATVARRLGAVHADRLAVPKLNQAGTRIDWYAPQDGVVVPWAAADEAERGQARRDLAATLAVLGQHAQDLSATAQGDALVFARQLTMAGTYPGEECIFLVNGSPVLTFWGFSTLSIPPVQAVQPPPPPPPSSPAVAAEPLPLAPSRRIWPWLVPLAALLLLLAALIPWYFLTGDDGQPLPSVAEVPPVAVVPPAVPAKAENVCADGEKRTDAVLVLDASSSMGLPMSLDLAKANALMWGSQAGDPEAIEEFKRLLKLRNGDRRIDVARRALARIVDKAPADASPGVVVFGACTRAPRVLGRVGNANKARILAAIRAIEPDEGTPLAAGLSKAASLVDGVDTPAVVVIISDGAESCDGDPCAVAKRLKRAKPQLIVNVVDITGEGAAACVAHATGGKVLIPDKADELDVTVARAAGNACQ